MNKLIVIEGIDGSGKKTQAQLLHEVLDSELISFPRYSKTTFGRECGNYLNGEFGTIDSIDPKLVSTLYGLDRYESKNLLISNRIKILDRYTPTNIAHQCAKIDDPVNREKLAEWIKDFEYGILGLPEPHLVIFLDVPVEVSQGLIEDKEKRDYTDKQKDLHESDVDYMQKSRDYFLHMSREEGYDIVNCVNENGELKSIEQIHAEIVSIIIERFGINFWLHYSILGESDDRNEPA